MALPVRSVERPATMVRWDPFQEIEDAWTRMGSLLGDVVGRVEGRPVGPLAAAVAPIDIEETDDAFIVEIELPGVRREEVSIDLRGNELQVTGEIKERERTGVLRRQTRRMGRFEHHIVLPGEVDPDSVNAMLDDGVLAIRLAKTRETQPKHIEVTSGGESK
ncbi:Hsp20/alpha crystallin family protein [Candidatus Protofrankia californiensis]|uniref:Hsp20/alpha crystallin family protein n=1 Tax=Candidatus Protofrankia californiensis TaxID=1839754 RepID=UPI0010413CB0|nr:Hsp20/alpha crystallin family protein [Candidatus Protofrankia californiensis]